MTLSERKAIAARSGYAACQRDLPGYPD